MHLRQAYDAGFSCWRSLSVFAKPIQLLPRALGPAGHSAIIHTMARNLDEELVRVLQVRTPDHGSDKEAAHEALPKPSPSFKAFLESMPNVGDDTDFERDRSSPGDMGDNL